MHYIVDEELGCLIEDYVGAKGDGLGGYQLASRGVVGAAEPFT